MKKMNKLFSFILMLTILIIPFNVFAQDISDTEIEYFDDGSYIVTETEYSPMSLLSTTKSQTISATYYNSNNNKEWVVKLKGTFSYTGSSATCTSASVSHIIYNTKWKKDSATVSKSGRTATGKFVMKYYVLGINTKTVNKTLTLSCSNSGTIS